MTENGLIADKIFQPGQSFSGTGISTSGNLHFTNYRSSDRYILLVECSHGSFISNNSDLFFKVKKGQKVLIKYKEWRFDDGTLSRYDLVDLIPIVPAVP